MTAARADSYLTLPPVYGDTLDGVQWSHRCDAVETENGTTVALAEELEELLAGVFAAPPVPHFAHVLTAYRVMKEGGPGAEYDRLRGAFAAARGAPAAYRNAGRLIADLCRGVTPPAGVPEWAEVRAALVRLRRDGERRRPQLAVEPSLPRAAFETRLAARLRGLTDDALRHWLAHGTGPTAAGRPLADPLDQLPARVAAALALARRRPRLAGAARLAPALDAALTLPPRRRSAAAVPQGGYADVTTRGDPARLLPSQLALDPNEFVRRFAERELLYFQREEPHAAPAADRVIVLDQGVRTWGGVRLALAAAAAVLLGKKAGGVPRLILTSDPGAADPAGLTAEALADRLEASDLSAHPAAALAQALAADPSGPRDVILLTHPRALAEPAVSAAAKGRRPGDRLFALAVDDAGRVELSEWTAGGPVSLRTFRVDLAAAEAARADEPPRPAAAPIERAADWSGDREPIGFPFRPGLVGGEPAACGFDADGEAAAVVSRDGVPHLLRFDGSPPEVLPRAFTNGAVLKQVEAVLGVRGGVVLCGPIDAAASAGGPAAFVSVRSLADPVLFSAASPPAAPPARRLAAAHYDLAARTVRVHDLGPVEGQTRWSAYPDLHAIAVRVWWRGGGGSRVTIDLDSGERVERPGLTNTGSRAELAWVRDSAGGASPWVLPIRTRWSQPDPQLSGPHLHLDGNTVRVEYTEPPWTAFTPTADGRPLLAGAIGWRAMLAGDVLAVQVGRPNKGGYLHLFRRPDGRAVRSLPLDSTRGPFALSPDGRRLAVVTAGCVTVSEAADAGALLAAARGRLHNRVLVALGDDPFCLTVEIGSFRHTFTVEGGRLRHGLRTGVPGPWPPGAARPRTVVGYDLNRFPTQLLGPSGRLAAVADTLGQVILVDLGGNPVAAVLVRREKAAAWVPGGRFWGDPELIGGPPTPDADAAVAAALGGTP